jgi:hypothetical protein
MQLTRLFHTPGELSYGRDRGTETGDGNRDAISCSPLAWDGNRDAISCSPLA